MTTHTKHGYSPRLRQVDELRTWKAGSGEARSGGSFWVGLTREQLRAAVAQHQSRMERSRMATVVDPGVRD